MLLLCLQLVSYWRCETVTTQISCVPPLPLHLALHKAVPLHYPYTWPSTRLCHSTTPTPGPPQGWATPLPLHLALHKAGPLHYPYTWPSTRLGHSTTPTPGPPQGWATPLPLHLALHKAVPLHYPYTWPSTRLCHSTTPTPGTPQGWASLQKAAKVSGYLPSDAPGLTEAPFSFFLFCYTCCYQTFFILCCIFSQR